MALKEIRLITIFPEIFESFLKTSLINKAREKDLINILTIDLRDYAEPPHYHVDDLPYGGGAGMVMKAEPLCKSIKACQEELPEAKTILLTPGGTVFTQKKAEELSADSSLILVCGRYEGVDQRVVDLLIDSEISIGDYVLMGGEIPAMVLIEATVRLVDKVIGNPDSLNEESFSPHEEGLLLEAPHYTRPAEFMGLAVPQVLLSGNHKEIAKWRHEQAALKTQKLRADLLKPSQKR